MDTNFGWETFVGLVKQVLDFKTKTSFTYVNADAWEEVLYFSLKRMGENPEWRLGSHAKGADIVTKKFAISAKSGKMQNGFLVISSYRLTRFENIKKMTDFIDDERNYDYYLCCAREKKKDGGRSYSVFRVLADVFLAGTAKWGEYKTKKNAVAGWHCITNKGIRARIVKKMSNQLWMEIPLEFCEKILVVDYKKNEIGSEFEKIFK